VSEWPTRLSNEPLFQLKETSSFPGSLFAAFEYISIRTSVKRFDFFRRQIVPQGKPVEQISSEWIVRPSVKSAFSKETGEPTRQVAFNFQST
jgi:hypothetical protein